MKADKKEKKTDSEDAKEIRQTKEYNKKIIPTYLKEKIRSLRNNYKEDLYEKADCTATEKEKYDTKRKEQTKLDSDSSTLTNRNNFKKPPSRLLGKEFDEFFKELTKEDETVFEEAEWEDLKTFLFNTNSYYLMNHKDYNDYDNKNEFKFLLAMNRITKEKFIAKKMETDEVILENLIYAHLQKNNLPSIINFRGYYIKENSYYFLYEYFDIGTEIPKIKSPEFKIFIENLLIAFLEANTILYEECDCLLFGNFFWRFLWSKDFKTFKLVSLESLYIHNSFEEGITDSKYPSWEPFNCRNVIDSFSRIKNYDKDERKIFIWAPELVEPYSQYVQTKNPEEIILYQTYTIAQNIVALSVEKFDHFKSNYKERKEVAFFREHNLYEVFSEKIGTFFAMMIEEDLQKRIGFDDVYYSLKSQKNFMTSWPNCSLYPIFHRFTQVQYCLKKSQFYCVECDGLHSEHDDLDVCDMLDFARTRKKKDKTPIIECVEAIDSEEKLWIFLKNNAEEVSSSLHFIKGDTALSKLKRELLNIDHKKLFKNHKKIQMTDLYKNIMKNYASCSKILELNRNNPERVLIKLKAESQYKSEKKVKTKESQISASISVFLSNKLKNVVLYNPYTQIEFVVLDQERYKLKMRIMRIYSIISKMLKVRNRIKDEVLLVIENRELKEKALNQVFHQMKEFKSSLNITIDSFASSNKSFQQIYKEIVHKALDDNTILKKMIKIWQKTRSYDNCFMNIIKNIEELVAEFKNELEGELGNEFSFLQNEKEQIWFRKDGLKMSKLTVAIQGLLGLLWGFQNSKLDKTHELYTKFRKNIYNNFSLALVNGETLYRSMCKRFMETFFTLRKNFSPYLLLKSLFGGSCSQQIRLQYSYYLGKNDWKFFDEKTLSRSEEIIKEALDFDKDYAKLKRDSYKEQKGEFCKEKNSVDQEIKIDASNPEIVKRMIVAPLYRLGKKLKMNFIFINEQARSKSQIEEEAIKLIPNSFALHILFNQTNFKYTEIKLENLSYRLLETDAIYGTEAILEIEDDFKRAGMEIMIHDVNSGCVEFCFSIINFVRRTADEKELEDFYNKYLKQNMITKNFIDNFPISFGMPGDLTVIPVYEKLPRNMQYEGINIGDLRHYLPHKFIHVSLPNYIVLNHSNQEQNSLTTLGKKEEWPFCYHGINPKDFILDKNFAVLKDFKSIIDKNFNWINEYNAVYFTLDPEKAYFYSKQVESSFRIVLECRIDPSCIEDKTSFSKIKVINGGAIPWGFCIRENEEYFKFES